MALSAGRLNIHYRYNRVFPVNIASPGKHFLSAERPVLTAVTDTASKTLDRMVLQIISAVRSVGRRLVSHFRVFYTVMTTNATVNTVKVVEHYLPYFDGKILRNFKLLLILCCRNQNFLILFLINLPFP